jgi:hypothetical protein
MPMVPKSAAFLKKEAKNSYVLVYVAVRIATATQKSFASFLQKRRPSLNSVANP